jgi:two-component system nitrate/nitrite response regulator NarL
VGLELSAPTADGSNVIRLYIISAIRLYGQGLARILGAEDGFEVCGTAPGVDAALPAIEAASPPVEVVVLDLAVREGVAGARLLLGGPRPPRVVAIGVREIDEDVVGWAEAGASGFVSREGSLDELMAAVTAVARGETACPQQMIGALLRRVADVADVATRDTPPGRAGCLTTRERQIVWLIDEGLSNKEIAARLQIELPTVKNHVHHVLEKLAVDRRGDAAAVLRASVAV